MAPITTRKGNNFSTMHNIDDRDELVHEDQGTTKGDNEEVQVAMRIQIEDLTAQLAESCLYDRVYIKLHPSKPKRKTKTTIVIDLQTLLRSEKRRYVVPLCKIMLIGGRAGSN
jgi:hypothetical protein